MNSFYRRNYRYYLTIGILLLLFQLSTRGSSSLHLSNCPDDTTKPVSSVKVSQLDKDEGIKCTKSELLDMEFKTVCTNKYGELLRITWQDLERGGREIIFQKKMVENDEVKFYMPFDLLKEAKMAVLIIVKGSGMFFKKIDITD